MMQESNGVYFAVSYPKEDVYGLGVAGPSVNGEEKVEKKVTETEQRVYREEGENANPEVGRNIDVTA